LYECIAVYGAVYVDDLLIAVNEIVQTLEEKHKFKLKGVGPLTYHFGCDYFCDHDGTLFFGPRKYIKKMMDQFKNVYDGKPKEYTSPLEKSDHPEMNTSEELDVNGIKRYQTMIGCLQWAVSIGWFDIQTATMTMCRFRVASAKRTLGKIKTDI
jgi:hypothetical protein